MIGIEVIRQTVQAQKENLLQKEKGLERGALADIPDLSSFALIVSGIRRCGKSTLLFQLLEKRYPLALYLNFEDPRLYDFELKDFARLDQLIAEAGARVLLFDEIQIVTGWERYARQKLDEGHKMVITGSNASLLSRELGTKLTGRHVTKELFPFSYSEFNTFRHQEPGVETLTSYLHTGGFPEYVRQNADEILNHILEDILIRDIAVRYSIRNVKSLQRLALNLLSNVGNLITANRLKSFLGVGSANTITDFLSYLEDSYLLYLVPKFDYSFRKQLVNPRKVYVIDTGLASVNSASFTGDHGRLLENLVYMHLRRKQKGIYYYSGKSECDFVVSDKGRIRTCVQVCYELTPDNMDRELNGLKEALDFFKLKEGTLVTLTQSDHFEMDKKIVNVVPAHQYLLAVEV